MRVLLLQLDGKIPNLALMRVSAHHRERGDEIEFRMAGNFRAIEFAFWEHPEKVYASLIFKKTRPLAERLLQIFPEAIIGGTGWDREDDNPPFVTNLPSVGISTRATDYSIWPRWEHSIGFTQRGCRMTKKTCYFCGVPTREGRPRAEDSIMSIWRGAPWPKNLLLLDNDTFGGPNWRDEVAVIRDGKFRVCWVAAQKVGELWSIFDVNRLVVGGWVQKDFWAVKVVPWIIEQCVPRASGRWHLTHAIEVPKP